NNGCVDVPLSFTNSSKNKQGWTFTWVWGDNSQSIAEAPSHTYNAANTYQVTVTADSANCKFEKTRSVNVAICIDNIEESELDAAIDVYPNPTQGLFNIQLTDMSGVAGNISVYDMQGKEVYNRSIQINGTSTQTLDI